MILTRIVTTHEGAQANIFKHNTLVSRRECIHWYRRFQSHTRQITDLPPAVFSGKKQRVGCTEGALINRKGQWCRAAEVEFSRS